MGGNGRDGLFEGIFATAIDGIIAIDERGTIESFNPAAEKLFGYSAREAVGQNVRLLMPSPDREAHDSYLHNYLSTGKRKIIGSGREVTALHKTGTPIPIHLSLSEAQVGGRRVFVGICRDIGELVRARGELEAARLRNDAVLDTAADGILTINGQGIVQSFNAAAEKLFGYSKSEVIGENVKRLMPRSIAEHHDGYLAHTLKTGERKIIGIGREVLGQRKDGSTFPAWLSVSQFRIAGADYFTGILRDVSELRRREDELRQVNLELEESGWLTARQLELNEVAHGRYALVEACQSLLDTVVKQLSAVSGVGYVTKEPHSDTLHAVATFAAPIGSTSRNTIRVGEGLLGQAARDGELRLLSVEPFDYQVSSSFGTLKPSCLALIPLMHNGALVGALELAFGDQPTPLMLRHIKTLPSACALILGTIRDQERIQSLLAQSQAQTEELQVINEQMDQRARELQAQQEEMTVKNEQLAEQKERLEAANSELERSRAEVEEKADALAKTARYKSEFLANMSHELRTPLNSVLILARVLLEDRSSNLTPDQVDSLKVIAGAGEDLLNLINDILDLSKIEAGKLRFDPEHVPLDRILANLQRMFTPLMNAKGLRFECRLEGNLPQSVYTDGTRLEQVLRNLLSNANKFTMDGSVVLKISLLSQHTRTSRPSLAPGKAIVFEVTDTGLGIPDDKQELVFQAFQQADTTLSRKFGGTGLGLSISSSLAEQLGGEIRLESQEGVGSTFTLIIPERHDFSDAGLPTPAPVARPSSVPPTVTEPPAPLSTREAAVRVLLVEDDLASQIALRKLLESRGAEVVASESANAALREVSSSHFDCIILDLMLGAQTGYEFLEALEGLAIASPPIIVHTGRDLSEEEERRLRTNARAVVIKGPRAEERLLDEVRLLLHAKAKPVSSAPVVHRDRVFANKRVLVVDDDVRNVFALRALLGRTGMKIEAAETGQEALSKYEADPNFDCILMDIMMPEMDGYEATRRIRELQGGAEVPIIALTAKAMKGDRQLCLDAGANDYMSKPVKNDELLGMMRVWLTR